MPICRDGHPVTLGQHLQEQQQQHPGASGQFSWLMSGITLATKMIASYVRRAGLIDVWGDEGSTNVQGEVVKKLDIVANDSLKRVLGYRGNVAVIASEEDNEPKVLAESNNEDGYVVMFDPLDGSSNIDVNVSVGTIFTIFRARKGGAEASVLQPGRDQVAAGYVLYGSSTVLVYTAGEGAHMFTLDPQFGAYLLTRENIRMPKHSAQYSVNEAYSHTFPEGYRRYLEWVKLQPSPVYSSRYVGSLVADFHRCLIKGGVYFYPVTGANPDGKLRLMYEANPLAFVAEQAGGLATDGDQRIMDQMPTDVHQRTPLIIGSKDNVEELARFVAPEHAGTS
ncbi:MAG: class 1 fructose-bisphosphatase [Planctomycetota bacterium]